MKIQRQYGCLVEGIPFLPVLESVLNLVVELVPALQLREVLVEVLVKECVVARQPCATDSLTGLSTRTLGG